MRDPPRSPSPPGRSDSRRRTGPSSSANSPATAGDPIQLASDARHQITQLLAAVSDGREDAWEPLMVSVYDELRRLAHGRLRFERQGHTLGTTALVHEAWLRLVDLDRLPWQGRGHFFAVAARAMRRILVDHARATKRHKRGGSRERVPLEEAEGEALPNLTDEDADELLALDQALTRLGEASERQRKVVELRFFSGLTSPETAEALGVGVNTVKRDWSVARAWLNRELDR